MLNQLLSGFGQEFLTSVLFIAALMALRSILIRMIRRDSEILNKDQRRWIHRIKNGTIILSLVGLIMVWAPQLETFALSLTAFAVALVVATKEMILCVMGSLLRLSTRAYKIGDWITIDGVNGEVMEINAFTTRLEEFDAKTYQFTGKAITIPNSKLFTSQAQSQNILKHYAFVDLSTMVQFNDLDPSVLMDHYRRIVGTQTQSFEEDAARFTRRINRKAGIDMPDITPSFGLRTTDLGHFVFTSRVFIPTERAGDLPGSIATEFLTEVYKIRSVQKAEAQLLEKDD